MKRKLPLIIIFSLLFVLAGLLSACQTVTGAVPVSAVTVETTEISMNTVSGNEYNTYQLYPIIYPDNATNKKVTFYFADAYDSEYITVSSTGLLTAKKEKKIDNEVATVEIMISSAENTKIKTSVFVTIENVAADEIYFNPAEKTVNLATAPFFVERMLRPAHASVGTDTTYSSTDTSVLTVDARTGLVTPVGHGTATVVATAYSTATKKGYLRVVVKYAPPQYSLIVEDGDLNNFEQSPGEQKKISFSLMPYGNSLVGASGLTLSDSDPRIVWSEGNSVVEPNPDTNATAYDFIPAVDVTAGVYYVSVTIKDADDQMLTLTSAPISIFDSLTEIMLSSSTQSAIISGDLIRISAEFNESERPPRSYAWYRYEWTAADDAAYALSGLSTPADYILTKNRPISTLNTGDFVFLERTDDAQLSYYTDVAGDYYIAAIPAVGVVDKPELMEVLDKKFEISPVEGTMISGLKVSYGYQGETLMPKLKWNKLGADERFVVEAISGVRRYLFYSGSGVDSAVGDTYTFYDGTHGYFQNGSFTFPATFDVSEDFTARVRTDSAFGWSQTVSVNAEDYSAVVATAAKKYYKTLEGLPFDLFIETPEEMGEILNYIRVVMPNTAIGNGFLTMTSETDASYDHVYTIPLAIDFLPQRSGNVINSNGTDYEKLSIVYGDGTAESEPYKHLLVNTSNISDQIDAYTMQGFKMAFQAYCETGFVEYRFMRNADITRDGAYVGRDANGVYYVNLVARLNEDAAVGSTIDNDTRVAGLYQKYPTDAQFYTPRDVSWTDYAASYDGYFSGATTTHQVSTGDELYYTATLGLKPLPQVGSAAEAVYAAAKNVMNSIMKVGMNKKQKVVAIYDWLTQNVFYDRAAVAEGSVAAANDFIYHLAGVFGVGTPSGKRLAVCDGFAKAFALMCWMENIPCYKISGTSQDVGHAWNKYFIDGYWYLADATWGGTSGDSGTKMEYVNHDYLFKADADFADEHQTGGKYPPTASSYDYVYYRTAGLYFTDPNLDDIANLIAATVGAGQKMSFDIAVDPRALNGRTLTGPSGYLYALAVKLNEVLPSATLGASLTEPIGDVKLTKIIITRS